MRVLSTIAIAASLLLLGACGSDPDSDTDAGVNDAGVDSGAEGDGGTTTSTATSTATSTDTGTLDSGTVDTGTDTDPPIDYCDLYATHFCAQIEVCMPLMYEIFTGGADGCEPIFSAQCEHSVGLPGAQFDDAEFDVCLAAIDATTCDEFVDEDWFQPEACRFTGTFVEDTACEDDPQCESGNCWFGELDEDCGMCRPAAQAVADDCSESSCPRGLFCDDDDLCVVQKADGEACTWGECAIGSECVMPDDVVETGTCMAGGSTGDACSEDGFGAPGCIGFQGNWCHFQSSTCEPVQTVGMGETCGFVDGSLVMCVGSFCGELSETTFSGTCEATHGVGEPCSEDVNFQSECTIGLECLENANGSFSCSEEQFPVCD